jgi:hypothetical protein
VPVRPFGQIDLRHVGTALVTAGLLGGGGFIWNALRPEPKDDQARAVEMALLKRTVAEHDATLKVVVPQLQRMESILVRMDEREQGVRPAAGKR